jgi:hypothetical protein
MTDAGKLKFLPAPVVAGLYRLIVKRESNTTIYIGEAANLARRFGNYRNPSPTQQTSTRLNGILCETLLSGGSVCVDIVFENVVLVVGGSEGPADLSNKAVRKLVEQAAIVAHGGINVELLNR